MSGFRGSPALLLVFAALGCGEAGSELAPLVRDPGDGGTKIDPCRTPNLGCLCSQEGQVVACGKVTRQSKDYVSCSLGERTCGADSKWGGCVGDTEQRFQMVSASGSASVKSLGGQADCLDACDPFCFRNTDTPSGITPPTGIDTLDGSVVTIAKALNSISACTSITISGATDLTVTQILPTVSPNTLSFNVALSPVGCYIGALPTAAWSIETPKIDRAVITGAAQTGTLTVVNPVIGPILITARMGGFAATTTANIKVNAGPNLGVSAGSDDTSILYPYESTVLPLSLTPPIVQWTQGNTPATVTDAAIVLRYPAGSTTATATFEWRGTQGAETAVIPIGIPLPPANAVVNLAAGRRFPGIPANVWAIFEKSAKGANADVILRRKSAAGWHGEKRRTIRFAQGQLKGTVYYQSYGTQLARNYAGAALPNTAGDPTFPGGIFGAATLAIRPGATAPTVVAGQPTGPSDIGGASCRVCHTASANGNVLVTQKFQGSNQISIVASNLQAATPTQIELTSYSDGRSAWPGLYPDGSMYFSSAGIKTSYSTGPAPGGLDGSDNNAFLSSLYSLTTAGISAPVSGVKYRTSGGTLLNISATAAAGNWGLKGALPVFSVSGNAVALVHAVGKVCPTGTVGCNAAESRDGDKRSIAVLDYNAVTKQFSNFRFVADEPATACNTNFHAINPCYNVWPSFLPTGTAVVYEKEVFHNGNVGGGTQSDYGGTRAGCGAAAGSCGNDGTKGELWWASATGSASPTRLNRANGRDAGGTLEIPTGLTSTTCSVGTMRCTTNADCCSNICSGSGLPGGYLMCTGILRYAGNTCTAATQCESGVCTSGVCTGTKPAVIAQPYAAGHSALVEPVLNYEPTVNPQPTFTSAGAPEYYWVVFTSRRLFGNIATVNPFWSDPRFRNISTTVTPKKLWVAAIRANRAAGTDPSFPAFYLPGQEWISGNSKAYWVQAACTAASATRSTATECQSNQDCCGAPTTSVCSVQTPVASPAKSHCMPIGACASLGGACSSDADCCGGIFCTNGTCQNPPDVVQYFKATYTRDYEAVCEQGKRAVWRFFDWQAVLPAGTSIKFTAQTAGTQAALATATPTVTVATALPPSTTGWTSGPSTVDDLLYATGTPSQRFLRVSMEFIPSADRGSAPQLLTWRQNYDCLWNE